MNRVKIKPWWLLLITLLFVGLSVISPFAAAEQVQGFTVNNAQHAARMVKGKYGGKVLKVSRTKIKGNPGYRVKILKDDGHVISVLVDAKSGVISRS